LFSFASLYLYLASNSGNKKRNVGGSAAIEVFWSGLDRQKRQRPTNTSIAADPPTFLFLLPLLLATYAKVYVFVTKDLDGLAWPAPAVMKPGGKRIERNG
jgi:hypothetical protein